MNIKIADIMAKRVITVQKHHSVVHARQIMEKNKISALPVVGEDNEALGIITSTDLAKDPKDETPCGKIMNDHVYTVPAYNDVSIAARIMRKHKIHHVVVAKEKRVTGLISSFDLLKLVDGKRFELKQAPPASKKSKKIK